MINKFKLICLLIAMIQLNLMEDIECERILMGKILKSKFAQARKSEIALMAYLNNLEINLKKHSEATSLKDGDMRVLALLMREANIRERAMNMMAPEYWHLRQGR